MTLPVLLGDQNLILNVEVRDIVLKIDIFGNDKGPNDLIKHLGNESVVGASWIDGAVIQVTVHLFGLIKRRNEL